MADKMTQEELNKAILAVNQDEELGAAEKARKIAFLNKQFENAQINASRSGKGTRLQTGNTRGKGSVVITFEEFDMDSPETLPSTVAEFMTITGIEGKQDELLKYALEGYNSLSQTSASDPIAEFVNGKWDKETVTGFRLIVRNMVKTMGLSLEDAVAMVKPGTEKKFASQTK